MTTTEPTFPFLVPADRLMAVKLSLLGAELKIAGDRMLIQSGVMRDWSDRFYALVDEVRQTIPQPEPAEYVPPVEPLGKLADLHADVSTRAPIFGAIALANIIKRMAEIDSTVTTSAYRDLKPGEQDEVPTGDHYNLLWDAILDEIHAVTGDGK